MRRLCNRISRAISNVSTGQPNSAWKKRASSFRPLIAALYRSGSADAAGCDELLGRFPKVRT